MHLKVFGVITLLPQQATINGWKRFFHPGWRKRQIFQCLRFSLKSMSVPQNWVQNSTVELFCQNCWWCFLVRGMYASVFSFSCRQKLDPLCTIDRAAHLYSGLLHNLNHYSIIYLTKYTLVSCWIMHKNKVLTCLHVYWLGLWTVDKNMIMIEV